VDVKSYLIELGYTDEDATTFASDEKMSKAITKAVETYEEAQKIQTTTATQKAELDKWWKETAQPAILNADSGGAAAKAEAARYKTYISSLKDQGYPVPDEWTKEGATTVTPAAPPALPAFDPQKSAYEMAQATARLYDLGEEYRDLYGTSLPGAASLRDEARGQNKPLTEYVRSKFNFDQKRAEISAKKEADRVASITKDITEKLEAKYAERSNPNLAPAVISRAAQVAEANKDHADSWKTKIGRTEAKKDRLIQFRNVAKTA
jgi:hypothetical protein